MIIDFETKVYQVVGAAMEVHRQLNCGFNELIYQEALAIEFGLRDIPFEREKYIEVEYKGRKLTKYYKADFICFGDIIVELKALPIIGEKEIGQVVGYLRATGFEKGLLLNFGESSLKFRTVGYTINR